MIKILWSKFQRDRDRKFWQNNAQLSKEVEENRELGIEYGVDHWRQRWHELNRKSGIISGIESDC